MSETVPAGLDALSPEDIALRDSMRDESDLPEPAASDPPAPEDIDLDAPEAEPAGDGRVRMVPHQQFHAANERRKAAEAKATAAELKLATETAKVNERLNILMQAAAAATTPPAAAAPAIEVPDVATDPVGHFKALYEQTQKTISDQGAILRGFQEQQQQAQAVQQLRNWASSQETAYEAQEPSYRAAMEFLRTGRHAELEAAGVLDAGERDRIIMGDITAIAMRSQQEGENFAARLYNIASKRGFVKKAAAPAIPALDQDAALPDAAARVERGRANSTTLGSAGSAPPPALSPERIANMSDAQFDALVTKMKATGGNALRDLMGH